MSPSKDTQELLEKEKRTSMFNNVVNTIIATCLVGVLTTNIVMYRQQGIMQYQLDALAKTSEEMKNTYITRLEADQRSKMRDIEFKAINDRISELESGK